MTKKEALQIVISEIYCSTSVLECQNCPRFGKGSGCRVTDDELFEAVETLEEDL